MVKTREAAKIMGRRMNKDTVKFSLILIYRINGH